MVTPARFAAAALSFLLGSLIGPASARPESAEQSARGGVSTAPRRCPVALPVGETAQTLSCGILTVPENYGAPGRRVEISYIVLHSRSLSPAPDPIVHLVGGPGGSAIESLPYRTDIFDTLRRSRDVILFDQRGAQYSSRLDCQPYFQALAARLEENDETIALFEELSEQDPDRPLGILEARVAMGDCAEGLERLGVDLTQYNSVSNVQDIANLVDALGYDTFNLYGISYGTRLALTMMRDRPENLRSVILDSAYPVHINNYENTTNLNEEVVLRLFDDCAADPDCAASYPDLPQRFGQVLHQVNATPIELAEPVDLFESDSVVSRVTPAIVRLLVNRFLDDYPWFAPYFPRIVYELDAGETTTLALALSGALQDEQRAALTPESEQALLTAEDMRSQTDMLQAERRAEFRQRPGFSWLNAVHDRASELPEPRSEAALFELYLLPASSRDVTVFTSYVETFFEGEDAEELLAALKALEPGEVRSAFEIISDLNNSDTTQGMHYAVECREEFPFNSRDRAQAIFDGLRFPLLGEAGWTVTNQATAVCEVWPSGVASAIENAAVTSDIPALILSGAYDTQTPPSWNQLAASSLTNAYLVDFPNTGHGVIGYSQCAEDIAEAFLNNPAIAPDVSCTAALQPEFVGLED